jgi:type III restriction enzyme
MKDNEKDENIPFYMENTRNRGIETVLIIDESHRQLNVPRAQELIRDYFKPIIQIEVSATPDSEKYDKKITVDMGDVIGSGMIKKEILVNEDIDVVRVGEFGDYGTDRLIIAKARQKQDELASAYEAVSDVTIRPLLLVQLPNESATTTDMDRTKMDRVKQILRDDFDITIENQRLAIWLSEDKTNKDLIDIANSPVEVLLFKQAIATGWDCPRAQILVMFRKIGSFTFEIQTIGRILRMPEQKHYENELLNKAYVYTDLEKNSIMVHDTAKNMIKNHVAIAKMDLYKPFSLPSTFASRGDYNDLGSSFYEVFFEYFLVRILGGEYHKTLEFLGMERNRRIFESRLDTKDLDITGSLIKDGKIFVDIDRHTGEHIIISDKHIDTRQEEELIELQFDNFCRSSVGPQFGNVSRSYKTIKECLFGTFERYIFGEDFSRMDLQKLVLKNKDLFSGWLNEIKDHYRPIRIRQVDAKTQAKFKNKTWSVPHTIGFAGEQVEILENRKYIYTPGYVAFDSAIERDFVAGYLDGSEEVVFWYKNGVQLDIYFGIKYELNGVSRMFYPDFVVYFHSGVIGIFETKDGITLTSQETREKAEALEKYALDMNRKGYKIISGIVKEEGIAGDMIFMIGKK